MKLNDIRDNPGANEVKKRLGRGEGSGLGKTCGRGMKGQKARTGVSINGFEGGQNPIYRRLPKRGFTNIFRTEYAEVTLARLQQAIDSGKLDPKKSFNEQQLIELGVAKKGFAGVKILATGEIKAGLTLEVSKASKAAVEAIEKAKGKVTLTTTA